MNTNLIIYDMEKFLNKYTRFMTKNIYISTLTYSRFLNQYSYLYETLEKEKYLYQDHLLYKKIMNIKKNQTNLIRLHNQKYLKNKQKECQSFFSNLYPNNELDTKRKNIILSEEEKLLVIQEKNILPIIVGKIKYLIEYKNYKNENILILAKEENNIVNYQEGVLKKEIDIEVKNYNTYKETFLYKDESLLKNNTKYDILLDYLINYLFPRKEKFNSLYKTFSKYIYLNKDYLEYETFSDYHNYMYKRKYLKSKLSLKRFNEKEIKTRKNFLRTIKNEIVKSTQEVDIANFLFLNCIPYTYNYNDSSFNIKLDEKENIIYFKNEKELLCIKNASVDFDINLYSSYTEKKTYLEVLAYELIKRRYPLELISEDNLYKKLKDTSISNYFSEFINKTLIPALDYYDENKSFDNTNLNKSTKEELEYIYKIYTKYLEKYNLINNTILESRMYECLKESNYKYLILIGDISISTDIPYLKIIPEYREIDLVKENIKLLYDYKKYLLEKQSLPIVNTYIDNNELTTLTNNFIKDNLCIINKNLEETNKEIEVYLYEDKNRLHIYKNISISCLSIISKENKKILIGLTSIKDINILLNNKYFTKIDKNTISSNNKNKITCMEISKIDKNYDSILLPYLITDNYHENLLIKNNYYHIKLKLFIALNKSRNKLILLCPKSRKKELSTILRNLKNIKIHE